MGKPDAQDLMLRGSDGVLGVIPVLDFVLLWGSESRSQRPQLKYSQK